jgi:hypothetical protein
VRRQYRGGVVVGVDAASSATGVRVRELPVTPAKLLPGLP